jgi:hypothetical protein
MAPTWLKRRHAGGRTPIRPDADTPIRSFPGGHFEPQTSLLSKLTLALTLPLTGLVSGSRLRRWLRQQLRRRPVRFPAIPRRTWK